MATRFIFYLLFISSVSNAQFLEDAKTKDLTTKGLDYLYNQQFDQADEIFQIVKKKYPNHPVKFLLNAIRLQWEFVPIDKNPLALKKYISELENCITSAKTVYKDPRYKKEATFFLLASYGFIALSHNYQKDFLEAAQEAKKAHDYFLQGKNYKNENAEFLFATGLYNFYRVQYPENHPIVKPIIMFFENGNKKLGLSELEASAKTSIFSRTEASMYLTNINIKYESNFKKARSFSSLLHTKYPNNFILKIKYIETLLLNQDFEIADKLNETLQNRKDAVSTISNLVFDGYLQEHYKNNLPGALTSYAKALKIPHDDRYTKEYHGMAYLGMARIFKAKKNIIKAKTFYKECLKIAEYKWVVEAAKAELKTLSP